MLGKVFGQRPGQASYKLQTWNRAASVVVVLHCVVFVILVFAVSLLHFFPSVQVAHIHRAGPSKI